jgi:hypothetical protein
MYEGSWISRVAGRAAAISLAAMILASVAPCSFATSAAPATSEEAIASPKTRELMTLLAQQWLEEQGLAKPAAAAPQKTDTSVEDALNSGAGAIHGQIVALCRTLSSWNREVTARHDDSARGPAPCRSRQPDQRRRIPLPR